MVRRWVRLDRLGRVEQAVRQLELPDAVFATCPWQPRDRIELGLRQWLRCAGVALRDGFDIAVPSRAVDEAWHGLMLCTARYADFCRQAYGRFLHHDPDTVHRAQPADELANTVFAWCMLGSREASVLWDLDRTVGVDDPWGVPDAEVAASVRAFVRATERARERLYTDRRPYGC